MANGTNTNKYLTVIENCKKLYLSFPENKRAEVLRLITTNQLEQNSHKVNHKFNGEAGFSAISNKLREKILKDLFEAETIQEGIKKNQRHFRHLDIYIFKIIFEIFKDHLGKNSEIVNKCPELFI